MGGKLREAIFEYDLGDDCCIPRAVGWRVEAPDLIGTGDKHCTCSCANLRNDVRRKAFESDTILCVADSACVECVNQSWMTSRFRIWREVRRRGRRRNRRHPVLNDAAKSRKYKPQRKDAQDHEDQDRQNAEEPGRHDKLPACLCLFRRRRSCWSFRVCWCRFS